MTKEELAQYSMEELNQMIDDAIKHGHMKFLEELTSKG